VSGDIRGALGKTFGVLETPKVGLTCEWGHSLGLETFGVLETPKVGFGGARRDDEVRRGPVALTFCFRLYIGGQ